MHDLIRTLQVKLQNLVSHEEGQDLVEYALVVALIAFWRHRRHAVACHRPQRRIPGHQLNPGQLHQLSRCQVQRPLPLLQARRACVRHRFPFPPDLPEADSGFRGGSLARTFRRGTLGVSFPGRPLLLLFQPV